MYIPVPQKLLPRNEIPLLLTLRRFSTYLALILLGLVSLSLCVSPAAGQSLGSTVAESINPQPYKYQMDRVLLRDALNDPSATKKPTADGDTCLLPPLTQVRSSPVSATALQVPGKAKREYFDACDALRDKKLAGAEKHLRKAVQVYPKYSAAWVTLGQLLATQNQSEAARGACSQGSTVEPNFVPAYLCLADLAVREKAWNDVLLLSNRALEINPGSNPIAYEYNAAANLRTDKLDAAEKSGLRALEIDKSNTEPRVHFVLAQIYEAKGDPVNEIAQLREYLKFISDPGDMAAITQVLAQLEKPGVPAGGTAAGSASPAIPAATPATVAQEHSEPETAGIGAAPAASASTPSEVNRSVPRAADVSQGCNLDELLPQVEHRIQEFVENVKKFTATEVLVHESFNKSGQMTRSGSREYDYIVSIEESIPGALSVDEFQNSRSSSGLASGDVVTKGLPALLLIFHPYYAGDFSMNCEGLTTLNGKPVYQLSFRQRDDKPNRIRSYRLGTTGPAYGLGLKGQAWFLADNFQIVKLEADLVKPIPEIQLAVDHTSTEYGPIHFQSQGIDIWLPQTADLLCERKEKRFHERITFSDYLLFAVDNKQRITSPTLPE
jgi:tetratricopeptide (TPR) repeat protein